MRRPSSDTSYPSAAYDGGRTSDAGGRRTHGCARQKSPRVSGSSATITSSTASRSAIERVCGTTTSIVGTSGQLPRTEITPRDGVYAHRPLHAAGARPLDHVSSPRPKTPNDAAVAVPEPFDDPDANADVRKSALYGLSARPYSPRCMPPFAIGGMFVSPRQMAPASRSRAIVNASSFATRSANAGLPAATVRPRTM
ncbi:hypothetical protein SRABI128_02968 [Microbacterium sp. Bi128]|nr:hypothetical protein SRABI128_02968 [Microbacterium sp. Bi128]